MTADQHVAYARSISQSQFNAIRMKKTNKAIWLAGMQTCACVVHVVASSHAKRCQGNPSNSSYCAWFATYQSAGSVNACLLHAGHLHGASNGLGTSCRWALKQHRSCSSFSENWIPFAIHTDCSCSDTNVRNRKHTCLSSAVPVISTVWC